MRFAAIIVFLTVITVTAILFVGAFATGPECRDTATVGTVCY